MGSTPAATAGRDATSAVHVKSPACWHCGVETPPGPFCARCDAIVRLPEHLDYFHILGLPRRLVIDAATLQRRYYDLNRRLHPDLYQTGPQPARDASLANTAAVNRAYRTLRDPVERGLYWLEVQGECLSSDNKRVPPELAALVFEVQEELEDLRAARGSAAFDGLRRAMEAERAELAHRRDALLERLQDNFARWDGGAGDRGALTNELKAILSTIAYLCTLLRDVSKELEP